ncbi:LysR family transcriptional regulator [Cedecea sp. NFIX57]|uniref:LysR family transcriptional regulator n=1 Tax=Cedecea sp. NFIX57 TaxID=1566286 RepID=UPI000A0A3A64|nr:LysR family transcriptional regulator [Cedecea sp. NFIX57]SMG32713.1 transcriptional regulator, LysR family [Cedecea sp. NFIX57]
MDHLKGIRLFVRVVESKSFVGAGKAEGVAQSTVSKEVSGLEARLNTQLIRRSSRGISVTEAGQQYYEFASGMLHDLDAVEHRLSVGETSPRGRFRVAVPYVLCSRFIMPALPEFLANNPGITLDIEASERYASLIEDGFDVAIRIGHLADSGLIARQIGSLEPVVVASPEYLQRHGTPQTLEDLTHHNSLPFLFQGVIKPWRFLTPQGEISIRVTGSLRANDAEAIHNAVRLGLGIAQGPRWMFAEEIAAGLLVPVLEAFTAGMVPIHAVTSARRRITPAIHVFVDYLAHCMHQQRHLKIR